MCRLLKASTIWYEKGNNNNKKKQKQKKKKKKKKKKTLVLITADIPRGNPLLQTSNEINASLQKLLRGYNIFTLYFTPTTNTVGKEP